MLHFREEDLIPGLYMRRTPGLGDEIYSLGRSASEDNFIGTAGIDEVTRASARGFETGGGAIAQLVDATVNVGIDMAVVSAKGIQDREGLLGSRSVIEIDERATMDFLIQNRKVGTQGGPIHFKANRVAVWQLRSSSPGSKAGPKQVQPRRRQPLPIRAAYFAHPVPALGPCRNPAPSMSF